MSQSFGVYPALRMRAAYAPPNRRWRMILNALVEKLKRRSKDDFKGRHFEATLILQAVSWYLRYPLSFRDIEELFLERGLEAAKRFFRKALQDQPLLSPDRIGTDGAGSYPPAIAESRKAGLLARVPVHYVTKHLQQGIESDHFRVKQPMPRVGCLQSFHTARRTIQGFEAMLWLRKGFGFAGRWTVCEQNRLLAICFGLPEVNKG